MSLHLPLPARQDWEVATRFVGIQSWKAYVPSLVNSYKRQMKRRKQELQEISAERLGEWQPGNEPTPQLLMFVSSRIKALKEKQVIKENTNPEVPDLLVEKKEKFNEEQDRVRTRTLPRCWRCQSRCQFCLKRKCQFPTFGNFRAE